MTGRTLRIAVVGSGPSGFYAAEALLKQKDIPVEIDMFDRLPTPYGLVRGGVAPDHQKIKNVIAVYEKVAQSPGFRFFGNVMLGRDIQAEDLNRFYDQVVYAVGNERDRHLGIPGEDLVNSHSATAFVGWYNGHPDYRDQTFDLNQESVAVIGIGNVAMDVTRILAEDVQRLTGTDIADYALEALRRSRVKTIYLLGRRGPAQAAFSPAEIREIGELPSSDLVVDPKEVELDGASKPEYDSDPEAKKNVDYIQEVARRGEGSKPRKVRLRFLVSPAEIIGENGRVTALKLDRTRLERDARGVVNAHGTGRSETIPVGLIFRSVGYRGVPIAGVPFDDKSGRIPNKEGRVADPANGEPQAGHYVVGWAKRGPSGLIGTNRVDSVATVNAMLADAKEGRLISQAPKNPQDVLNLLQAKKIRYITFQDWKYLDKIEVEKGTQKGKIRDKFTTVPDMLSALEKA